MADNAKAKLAEAGVSVLHAGAVLPIPKDSIFEPPCSLKWMVAHHRLRMGAFSYAVSGYYFNAVIGRYVSIGEQVQIGRGSHPVSWISTSPVFYQNYKNVIDLPFAPAEGAKFKVPPIGSRPTIIGNDVYIGHGAFIMQGVTIGDGAIVGACSVVTKDVPPYAVVAGSPAVVKKYRFTEPQIERLLNLAWWRFAFWDLVGAPPDKPDEFLDILEEKISSGMEPYNPTLIDFSKMA